MKVKRADPVLVPRWYCTWGTNVTVVAAETVADARAIMAARYGEPAGAYWNYQVRPLTTNDEDRLAAIEAAR